MIYVTVLNKKWGTQMDLLSYLYENNITMQEFANKINYTREYISRVIHGKDRAGRKFKQIVFKETNGQVILYGEYVFLG